MNTIKVFLAIAITALLSACGSLPKEGENAIKGGLAGAALGYAATGNSQYVDRAAAAGAVLGWIFGNDGNLQQVPGYGRRPTCQPGDVLTLVCRSLDGNFSTPQRGEGNQPFCFSGNPVQMCRRGNNQQFQGNAVCGQAAMHMQCSSVAIPGTNCRRCQ